MFADDRQLGASSSTNAAFPQDPIPFPDNADFFYDHLIPPPEIIHQPPHLPPQKLRPIRHHSRPLAQGHSDTVGVSAQSLHGFACPPLGFMLEPQLSLPDFHLDSAFPETASAEDALAALRRINPADGLDFVLSELKKQIPPLDSTSSSSEDGDDSPDQADEISHPSVPKSNNKKRKQVESFLEDLMMQVIHRQEQMHKQLIEMIERREAERILREEAWKRQEIELAKREQAIRAQETSRSLALISFIEKALGVDGIQTPQPVQSSTSEEDDSEIQTQSEPNNQRWPKSEVQALIALRAAFDHRSQSGACRGKMWDEISAGLGKMGYSRSAKKCRAKWVHINKFFKMTTDNGKKHPEIAKSCPYYQELEILYRQGFIN